MEELHVQGSETVSELATLMSVSGSAAISVGFKNLGRMFTIHQQLDFDEIRALAREFGFEVHLQDRDAD